MIFPQLFFFTAPSASCQTRCARAKSARAACTSTSACAGSVIEVNDFLCAFVRASRGPRCARSSASDPCVLCTGEVERCHQVLLFHFLQRHLVMSVGEFLVARLGFSPCDSSMLSGQASFPQGWPPLLPSEGRSAIKTPGPRSAGIVNCQACCHCSI